MESLFTRNPRRNLRPSLLWLAAFSQAVASEPARAQLKVIASSQGGPAGGELTVRVTSLPPGIPIFIGFGGLGAPHELLGQALATPDGELTLSVRIPSWAERNRSHFFFLTNTDQRPRGFSDPFVITGPENALRLRGTLERVEPGCILFRGNDDTLFTLSGATGDFPAGTRVTIDGTLARATSAGADGNACDPRPSIAVDVREVRAG
jgi:hypothetical protein